MRHSSSAILKVVAVTEHLLLLSLTSDRVDARRAKTNNESIMMAVSQYSMECSRNMKRATKEAESWRLNSPWRPEAKLSPECRY